MLLLPASVREICGNQSCSVLLWGTRLRGSDRRKILRSSIGRLIECVAPALHAGLKGKVVVSQLFMLFPGRSHHAGVEGSSPSLFNQVRMMPGHPQEGWSP